MPDNPYDPTSFTGGPDIPKPSTERLTSGDVFDIAEIEQTMGTTFSNLFKNAAKTYAKEMGRATGQVKKFQDQYYDFVMTKERKYYDSLVKNQERIKRNLEAQKKRTETNIAKLSKDEIEKAKMLEKKRLEISEKIKRVEKANAKEISQAKTRAEASEGSFIAKAGIAGGEALGAIPGLGKLVKAMQGWAIIVTALITVFAKASKESREFMKIQASLREVGSGLRGTYGEALKFFDAVGGMRTEFGIGADEAREFVATLAQAPEALNALKTKEGVTRLRTLEGVFGDIGITIPETMKLIAEAQRDQSLGTEELIDTYTKARTISDSTNLTFKESFNTMLNMNKQMRNLTFNSSEAAKILVATTKPLMDMGMAQDEIQRFASSISQALGNFSPSKLAGLMSFVQGSGALSTAVTDDFLKAEGQFEMFTEAFTKILGEELEEPTLKTLVKIQKFAEQFGFSAATTTTGAQAFLKVLQGRIETKEEFDEALAKTQNDLNSIMKRGFETMSQTIDPMTKLKKGVDNAITAISQQLVPAIRTTNRLLDRLIGTFSLRGFREDVSTITQNPLESLKVAGSLAYSSNPILQSLANLQENISEKALGNAKSGSLNRR